MNDNKYAEQKLKYDLADNQIQKNVYTEKVVKIKVKIEKNEENTNFTRNSQNSNNQDNYYEKVNSSSLEDSCKEYIISKINDLINENIYQIEFIEMFKILFSLNFFIPFVDENYSLKFIPVAKLLSANQNEYGFQEFDYMFKVIGADDIKMNQENNGVQGLPFVKSCEIKISSDKYFNGMDFEVQFEQIKEFSIKKNSLVIIENKLSLNTGKIIDYITNMLKMLNFVIKLIKNTTKDFRIYDNIQLLLIYDDIIVNPEDLKEIISISQIKTILNTIKFSETVIFYLEIIYISQSVNVFNKFKSFQRNC